MQSHLSRLDDPSRRLFVTRAARAFLGVGLAPRIMGLPSFAGAADPPRARAKHVIYLYMTGGMSHLDTFDPKPGTEVQGPTKVIDTKASGIQVSEYLSRTAAHMDKIALVRSLSTKQGAHDRGQYFMRTSYTPIATTRHPAIGAWTSHFAPKVRTSLPPNVLIGAANQHPGAGFLDSRLAPLPVGNPKEGLKNSSRPGGVDEATFEQRLKLIDRFDRAFRTRYPQRQVNAYTEFYADAVKLMKSEDLKAFDLSQEKPEARTAYGDNNFGQGVLLARRLVQHGVRFVEVTFGSWDTHADNFDRVEDLAGTLDQALSALLADLSSSGLLKDTLVVVATEFGRTPNINGAQGRDHHPRVFTCLMAGGGVKGGYVHGASDKTGYAVDSDGVGVPDFNATIAYALGVDTAATVKSPDGRPFTVADKGKPITTIFA